MVLSGACLLLYPASALAQVVAPAPAPTGAADDASAAQDGDIVVTGQRNNQTEVRRRGQVGILGDKDAADVPFSVKSYDEQLILNQQPQTLGQVLENDPTIRTTSASLRQLPPPAGRSARSRGRAS